jgi:hypothetical protein
MAAMSTETKPAGLRKYLRVTVVAVPILLVAALAAAWAAFRHIPSWYRPVYVPLEAEQDARDELGAAFTELSRGMGQGRPFDFIVRQDELNRWLVARDRIWPASKRWIPEQIADPMIVFDRDEVRLAGTWRGPGPRTVLSVRFRVEMKDGRLRATVQSVRGGSLPVPLAVIKREIDRLERNWADRNEPLMPEGGSIVGAMEGAPLPNEIPWSQPKGKFRIESLSVAPGELRARLVPMVRRAAGENDFRTR